MSMKNSADMKLLLDNAGYTHGDMAYWAAIEYGKTLTEAAYYSKAREEGATAQEALRQANRSYR